MPSEKVLEAKKAQVVEITEALKGATTGVLVDYRGLTVEEDTKLRSDLRAAGVKYFVVKNTLLRLATKETGLEELDSILHGPTALAVSEDAVAPAKILSDFAKDNSNLEIKSGFMDGKVLSLDELNQLAKTPSKEVLISRLLGSMQSPIANLARVLDQIAEKGGAGACESAAPAAEASAEEAPAAEASAEEAPAAE